MEPEPEPESDYNLEGRIIIPQDFYCPISGELMENPISDPSGHTYEEEHILKWLDIKEISPITNAPLTKSELSFNIAMKRSIESIRKDLKKDQLKVASRISDKELSPFTCKLKDIKINQYLIDDNLFINIQTPHVDIRPPIDIVLCIDVSHSMFDEASLKGDKNETINYGISVLSLTITAAKTILNSLNENDNISIVTYSSEAKVLFDHLPCSPGNKRLIESGLDLLKPLSTTNMWEGIIHSLDILRLSSPPKRNKGIILLTDGIPNVIPPKGHAYMLDKYFKQHNFKCMISCYGFGYNLDSELLLDISNNSGGDGFSFIPDASILGSVFINGITNLLITALYDPLFEINLSNGAVFKDSRRNKHTININSLKYGKEKNLRFKVDTSQCSKGYNDIVSSSLNIGESVITSDTCISPTNEYMVNQLLRYDVIDIINDSITLLKFNDTSFQEKLDNIIKNVLRELSFMPDNEYIKNILDDLNGQIKEALNMTRNGQLEDWFSKWGIHYLRSLQDAYNNELCNNFKDKGIINFKGETFNIISDYILDIFENIDPPKQDIIKKQISTNIGHASTRSRIVQKSTPTSRLTSMGVFYNPGGGCCIASSNVKMYDGSFKCANTIVKGDRVLSYDINNDKYIETTIECVLRTECLIKMDFIRINNLTITPYHPIYIDKGWVFPTNVDGGEKIKHNCKYIYTFITTNRFPLIVDHYIFSTLAHNLVGEVISHEYFGSNKVIEDLKRFEGYNNGIVDINLSMIHRNKINNNVYKISGGHH